CREPRCRAPARGAQPGKDRTRLSGVRAPRANARRGIRMVSRSNSIIGCNVKRNSAKMTMPGWVVVDLLKRASFDVEDGIGGCVTAAQRRATKGPIERVGGVW